VVSAAWLIVSPSTEDMNLTTIVSRFGLAAMAVCAGIWMALALGSARAERRLLVNAYTPGPVGHARLARGLEDARAARKAVPNAPAQLLEWRLRFVANPRAASSDRLLLSVVRKEPENFDAWYYLSRGAHSPALRRRAQARVRALHPL
jgi:hypothetical protein